MSSKLELGGSSFYFLARTVRKDTLAFLRSVAMSKAPILRSIEFRKKPSLDLDFKLLLVPFQAEIRFELTVNATVSAQ